MLVLKRKKDESIMIGKDITVTVLQCDDGTVKLGIEAPKEVKVYRKEIITDVIDENKHAIDVDINVLDQLKSIL